MKVLDAQSWLTDCDPMDCSVALQASVHGISQARILEWVAIPFSRGSTRSRDLTWVSCTAGRFFTIWATNKTQFTYHKIQSFKVYSSVAFRKFKVAQPSPLSTLSLAGYSHKVVKSQSRLKRLSAHTECRQRPEGKPHTHVLSFPIPALLQPPSCIWILLPWVLPLRYFVLRSLEESLNKYSLNKLRPTKPPARGWQLRSNWKGSGIRVKRLDLNPDWYSPAVLFWV